MKEYKPLSSDTKRISNPQRAKDFSNIFNSAIPEWWNTTNVQTDYTGDGPVGYIPIYTTTDNITNFYGR